MYSTEIASFLGSLEKLSVDEYMLYSIVLTPRMWINVQGRNVAFGMYAKWEKEEGSSG